MEGEVVVMGKLDHLEVWNHERFETRKDAQPFGDDDWESLSEADI
jgi:DNA-binding transcriptional regulator/RsmH inhibitor MraZ